MGATFWTLLVGLVVLIVAVALIGSLVTDPIGLLTSIGTGVLVIALGIGVICLCEASKTIERIVVVILFILLALIILIVLAVVSVLIGIWVGPYLHHLLPGIIPEIPSDSATILCPELWVGFLTLVTGCGVTAGLIWLGTVIWEPLRQARRKITNSTAYKSAKGKLCCPFAWTD